MHLQCLSSVLRWKHTTYFRHFTRRIKNRTGQGTECFAVWVVPTVLLQKAQVLYGGSGGLQSQPSTVQLSPYYMTWSIWVCCEAISVTPDTVLISSTTKSANTPDMGSIGQYTSKFRVLNSNSVIFIVAPCIMESIYCSLTNKCTFY
jgi:hypothetical protein